MSIPVIEEIRPLPLGIALALYPGRDAPDTGVEIQRAPDSGGAPDVGAAVTIATLPTSDRALVDYVGGAGPYHYRARHVRGSATPGAYTSWVKAKPTVIPAVLPNIPQTQEVMSPEITFDANGQVVASVAADFDAANIYIRVGDGSAPSDPTAASNHGSVAGRSGTITTTQKVTTGNDAYVKVVAADALGNLGEVRTFRMARRLGPFIRDSTLSTRTGVTTEGTLKTITVPANVLGSNGTLRLEVSTRAAFLNGTKTIRVKVAGTTVVTFVYAAADGGSAALVLMLTNNGVTNQQVGMAYMLSHAGGQIAVASGASPWSNADTTAAWDITITGQLSDVNDEISVEYIIGTYPGTN